MTVTVYVLRSKQTGKRYVGITKCLPRRMEEHRRGTALSSRILGDFVVLMTEMLPSYAAARDRERFLKGGQGRAYLDERFGRGLGV
jgi:predicted GIY-YIG superfamily endonuclease